MIKVGHIKDLNKIPNFTSVYIGRAIVGGKPIKVDAVGHDGRFGNMTYKLETYSPDKELVKELKALHRKNNLMFHCFCHTNPITATSDCVSPRCHGEILAKAVLS